jgi:hypothetical protein
MCESEEILAQMTYQLSYDQYMAAKFAKTLIAIDKLDFDYKEYKEGMRKNQIKQTRQVTCYSCGKQFRTERFYCPYGVDCPQCGIRNIV